MRRALQKIGGSSSSLSWCRQHSPSANPIPKPNPSSSLPHSSSSALFNRVSNRVHSSKVKVPGNYFYCDTEDFKEILIDYKNDKKKMRPHVTEARLARLREHGEDDEKLMKELGVLMTVHLSGEDGDLSDMDPEELNQLAREHIRGLEWKEVKSPLGGSTLEIVGQYPPNPYGVSGAMFSLMGPAAAKPGSYRW